MLTAESNVLYRCGVVRLTGEACGLNIRVLCDLTANGVEFIQEFLGIQTLVPAPPWNGGRPADPHVGSIMLSYGTFEALTVYAMVKAGAMVVAKTTAEDIYGIMSQDELRQFEECVGQRVSRMWRAQGTSHDVTRNTHEATGRVA